MSIVVVIVLLVAQNTRVKKDQHVANFFYFVFDVFLQEIGIESNWNARHFFRDDGKVFHSGAPSLSNKRTTRTKREKERWVRTKMPSAKRT